MRYLIITLFLFLTGCGSSGTPSATGRDSSSALQFVAFGDAGTGSANQIAVGEAMGKVCAQRGCDFALELGDNFYVSGVTSVDDAQFEAKFETPYKSMTFPIWVTLGNHDNSRGPGEGSENARGDYQVDYHYLAGRVSDKWRMPARYYNFTAGGGLAEFFSLDSNPLTSIVADPTPEWNFVTYGQAQQEWLTDGLEKSTATWKIVFSHHPYLSNGLHGNAGTFDGQPAGTPGTSAGAPWKQLLDATLCAKGVELMIVGHDHELEHLKPVASCGKTHFIVSGAAEGPRAFGDAARNANYWQKDLTLGFFLIRLEPAQFTVTAYTLDAAQQPVVAYEQTLAKP
jgi:hypothetical protein